PPQPVPTWPCPQVPSPGGCGLDAALAEELLQLLGPEGSGPPGATPTGSPPGRAGPTEEEEEEEAAQRKQRGGSRTLNGQQAGQQRVQELTEQNEQLRAEIRRLSAEVQRARAALIARIVGGHRQ
ncbi:DDIT3 protein, partial [Grallaria varia]|nr:DDIT3 protein [Grallaria varia]